MRKHHRQIISRGYTLVELAMVLTIIGFVLAALWLAASQAWEYSRREQTREAIVTTVTNARSYFGGQEGVPGVAGATLTNNLINAGVIPSQLQRLASDCPSGTLCADHPWISAAATSNPGTFQVCNWTLKSGCGTAANSPFFGVSLSGLYESSCVALVQMMSSATEPPGLLDININGTNLVADKNEPISPVSDTDTLTYCAPAATPDPGTGVVTLVYRVVAPSP